MPMHQDPQNGQQALILENCIVVWDSLTRPEKPDHDPTKTKWALKVVVPPNSPDLPLLEQMAMTTLQTSEFQGVLPANGKWVSKPVDPQEFDGLFPGYVCVNAGTYRAPEVYGENQDLLDPMQYAPLIYSGQCVDLLVNTYSYNNKSKGVAVGLIGVRIKISAQAQRLNIGGVAGAAAANAFGAGAVAQPGQPMGHQPQPGQPMGHQPQPGQPMGHQPQPGQPMGHQPQPGQPMGHQPQPGQPQPGQAPQQANNYLPPQQ